MTVNNKRSMKNKLSTLFVSMMLFATGLKAQNNIPPRTVVDIPNAPIKLFRVTGVSLTLDSTVHNTSTSTYSYYFRAVVNSIGTGTISWQWLSGGVNAIAPSASKTFTQVLNGTGTDVILKQMGTVRGGPVQLSMKVLSPTALTSNVIEY